MISRMMFTMCAAAGATIGLLTSLDGMARANTDSETNLLVDRATQAHVRLMRGDMAGYRAIMPFAQDFMLMDPFGGKPTELPRDDAHWERIGRFFREGRDATFELVSTYRSLDLIVLVAIEKAHVAVGSLPAQDWSLRVTLVFRRDAGDWRLVHRHADPLASGITLEQAARLARGMDDEEAGA